MAKIYNHKKIEKKWQERWEEQKLYEVEDDTDKENIYNLVEFPYPSGNLHVGHWYAFAVPDISVRYQRMKGKNVLFPIGFDAFGLPAENAAIKHGVDPAEWTKANIENMEGQLRSMGNAFDWSRKIATCTPEYYKWNQWLFTKFFEKGIAYRDEVSVNWDPIDQTVLANEQVLSDGTAERSGAVVEKKKLTQWMFKITEYADRLLEDLEDLDWPNEIKEAQRQWIGKKEGINITYKIEGSDETVTCFTTRPDTNFGATFVVVAPEHPFAQKIASGEIASTEQDNVAKYVETSTRKSELERLEGGKKKTGAFTGFYAINELNGKRLPIWVGDFVLAGFGTGAVVGVPGHDDRDFAFAQEFGIEIVRVVVPPNGDTSPIQKLQQVQEEDGTMINSEFLDGLNIHDATKKITDYMEEKGVGERTVSYRIRDWVVSRQRYWGTPIPIVYDPEGTPHAIPEEHLPWLLPTDVDYQPKGTSPLGSSIELKERTERIFGKGWTPEIDTMDTFFDSSWYFLRFLDSNNDAEFSSLAKQQKWMPVAFYSGGQEHTTMHALYARFFYKVLFDMGLVTHKEPFNVRVNRGMILAEDGRKMSKRWGNVVDPDKEVEKVGADAVKMYLAFMGPYGTTVDYPWSPGGVVGMRRFLERINGMADLITTEPVELLDKELHKTIKKVDEDIPNSKFNTAIAQMMIFVNHVEKVGAIGKDQYKIFVRVLAPFAPHITEELWEMLGNATSVHAQEWPAYQEELIADDVMKIVVQVNGKKRAELELEPSTTKEEVLRHAKEHPNVQKWLENGIQKEVYVEGRLVSIATN